MRGARKRVTATRGQLRESVLLTGHIKYQPEDYHRPPIPHRLLHIRPLPRYQFLPGIYAPTVALLLGPFFALLPFVHRLRPPNDPSSPPTQLVPRAVSTTRSYRSIPGHKCGACKLHQQRRIINECCCARICSAALFHRSACPARGCVSRIPVNRIMYARVQRATFSNADVISPKLHYVTMYFRTSISLRRLPFNQDLLPLSRSVLRPISKLLTLN